MSSTHHPPVATATDLHVLLGVKPGTLRQWHRRGKVAKLGRDAYVVADVVALVGRSA